MSLRILATALTIAAAFAFYSYFPETTPLAQNRSYHGSLFAKFAAADGITKDIRDPNREIVRVYIKSQADRKAAEALGHLVSDHGPFVVVSKDKKKASPFAALAIEPIEMEISLPNGKFDPVVDPPTGSIRSDGAESIPNKGYYIVQFGSIPKDEWIESLRDTGVEIVQYVPNNAFFVYGDGEAISKAAGHSRVRWAGKYVADQKLSSHVRAFSRAEAVTSTYDIAVFSRAQLANVASELSMTINARVLAVSQLPNNFFNVIRVQMDPSDLTRVAEMPDVFRVDPYIRPTLEDERAAQIVAGNYSSPTVIGPPGYNPLSQFGVDGTGVTVTVADDGVSIPAPAAGFYVTSANTVDGPLRGATAGASGGHGHINASIIAGTTPYAPLDPLNFNYGRGVAPGANIINIPFLKSGNTSTDSQAIDDSLTTLGPNGAPGTITNNSWGNGTNGNSYDSYTAQYDGFVRDGSAGSGFDPITIVFSAGNSGTSGLTRPKVAKNVIAVGNSENIRTELGSTSADNMDDLEPTSSRGPAADGRIKPDITAPGTVITGSRAGDCSNISGCFDANHAYSTGTSHAAPQVAGAAALFTEYWRNANNGNYPSPAMIKASIISSAQEMNGVSTGTAIPNGNEGWGRINMKLMMNTGVPMQYFDQVYQFGDAGSETTYTGRVGDSAKPVRFTLVWTDPPGVSDPALVNDLDLVVTVGANTYRGNVFGGGISVTGGSADTRNNVENVFLPAGINAGTPVSITVRATRIVGDGILGNGDQTDQNFALVAYNVEAGPAPAVKAPFDFDGDGRTDASVNRPTAPGQASVWWYRKSSDNSNLAFPFGLSTDLLVPADYTGDGKSDLAVFRSSTGFWYVLRSEDNTLYGFPFGSAGDVPAPSDFDGDGMADSAVFRPANGNWYVFLSAGGFRIERFGMAGDMPVADDYDGDGKADIAIFRPSGGSGSAEWWIRFSSGGDRAMQFGTPTDRAVPGDYTGDGKADLAIWRPSTGFWYVLRSEDLSFYGFPFGVATDVPVPGDYDGDGRLDAGIFRGGQWYINTAGGSQIFSFGTLGDTAIPSVYVR